jgi:hypothetical protein
MNCLEKPLYNSATRSWTMRRISIGEWADKLPILRIWFLRALGWKLTV